MDSALEFDAFDAVYEDSVEQCEYIAEQGRRLEARCATKKVGQLAKAAAIRDGRTECFKCPLPHRCRRIWKTRKSFTTHMRYHTTNERGATQQHQQQLAPVQPRQRQQLAPVL